MNSRVIWTLALLVVLSFLAIFMYRQRENPPPKIRDISGGLKIQRQRIDRAIATAGELNVDEAISSLSQYNESYELAQLASFSPASAGKCYTKSMFADRRISKVFEYLSSVSSKEADMRSQQIFEENLATLLSKWKEWTNFKLKKVETMPKAGAPHHAASAGLFLCSYFCSRDTLDLKIQRWNDTLGSPEFNKIEGIQRYTPTRRIDPLFHLNLLVISGQRRQKSVKQLNTELKSLCQKMLPGEEPFLQVTQMRMFKWNAETLDTDFTHITRGVPASGNSVLLELPGFADPDAYINVGNPDVAKFCENCIRTWRDR